jgi:hypothetical protein
MSNGTALGVIIATIIIHHIKNSRAQLAGCPWAVITIGLAMEFAIDVMSMALMFIPTPNIV